MIMNQDKTRVSFLKSIRNEEIKNIIYLLERAWNHLTWKQMILTMKTCIINLVIMKNLDLTHTDH